MKKLLFTFCLCLLASLYLNAQTNTFPTSGNAGIGTLSPSTKLAIQGDDQSLSVAFGAHNYSTTNPIGAKFGSWNENGTAGIKFHRWLGSGTLFHVAYVGQALYNYDYGLDFRTNSLNSYGDATTSRMYIKASNGNVGIGTTDPRKKLEINGDILLENYTGIKQIFTWSPDDPNWRIGMNENPGFNRSMSTGHIHYLTYGQGLTQGFAVGVNGGDSSLEIKGFDHTAFFRGNVGIGTTSPDSKLTVKGNIHTNEVKVDLLGAVAPDYVFYKDYDLKSLKAVEDYIGNYGHLPNIPSAKEMETEGIMLKEMNLKLLEKIEELTLYAIEQEKRMDALEAENKTLKTQEERIAELEKKLTFLLNKN